MNEIFLDKLGTDPKKVTSLALDYLKNRLEALDGRPSISIEDVVVSRHEEVVKLEFVLMYRQKGLVCTESWTEQEILTLDKPITAMMEKVLYTALKTLPIKDPPPPVDMSARTTIGGTPVGEHLEINPETGMQKDYIVLTAEERKKGFVRPVRSTYKHLKCGQTTTMGQALAETYAREPTFYSGTYCCECKTHFPVGESGEFVWYGTKQKVGT